MIPPLSFYVRIEPLSPNYGSNGQPVRHGDGGYWMPPDRPNGLTNGPGPTQLLRWEGGRISIVPANNPIRGINLNGYVYRAATIFTQYSDIPHLLTVPFDARTTRVDIFGPGWLHITFNHIQVENNNSAYYSYISTHGGEQKIAAPGLPNWIPQLLLPEYNCDPRHATRIQAGLIGELPLLFALAAFSALPERLGVMLLSSMQPGKWISHGSMPGRK